MFRKADQQVRAALATLGIVLVALLTQAFVVRPQVVSVNRSVSEDTPDHLFDVLRADISLAATASPASLALADVAGTETEADGGLWLSGDRVGGFTYLHWIADYPREGLLKLDRNGRVSFNLRALSRAAGITSEGAAEQRERIASFIRSNEGLMLLAELTNGAHRYLLYVGPNAPTRAGGLSHYGLINLDNMFDSRVNPIRRNGQKLDRERPPDGFDSLVAIDPNVSWFSLDNKRLIPTAQMTFHELAEAHARVALALDYLPQGGKPGAHNVAIAREIRLKVERPGQFVVMPVGYNLRLSSRDDWLRLFLQLDSERTKGRTRPQ
jgi:hypothetical protein